VPEVRIVPFDPGSDAEALVTFLSTNTFPFHVWPHVAEADARDRVSAGHYWSDERTGHWVELDGVRIGIAVLEDVDDIPGGGAPLFDLRLADGFRGNGLGEAVLRRLTSHVFETYSTLRRFEGQTREDNIAMRKVFVRSGWVKEAHYREAWPVDGGDVLASIAYGILRRDWESGTTTPVNWDDLPA
jgi:RimJ/RimL family protein N-acetyltransferase